MTESSDQQQHATADVKAQRVAQVYAEALLNAAEKQGQADEVAGQLDSLVQDVFAADSTFEAFLASAAIGRKSRDEVVRKVFEGRATPLFFHFLLVLNEHDRLDLLRAIRIAFRDLRDQRARRIRVQVKSVSPLTDPQREELAQLVRQGMKLEPVLESQIDPEIIGGLVVRVGDWLYDASVRTQLETIRKQLIERSSHEIQAGRNRFGD